MTVMGVKNWIAVGAALTMSAALAACTPPTGATLVAPTLPPEKPLQTSADVAWAGPGSSAAECGSFVISFRFSAIDPRTVAKVRGHQMTIKLNTAVGKKPGAALVKGGPLDGSLSTQLFDQHGVASYRFQTSLRKGAGFTDWSAAAVDPLVTVPPVAAGRQC